ncbi:MAG: phosphotransferase family protein [Gammaproteobacteria bacterium]|nr:phosphotransferase family protein [Gammaproteobacteria bacterium]
MTDLQKQVQAAIAAQPQYANLDMQDYSATRLGGLTNLVFRLEPLTAEAEKVFGGNIIVRIPGQGTEEFIDRKVEAFNAEQAAKAGVSAQIINADAESGLMISRCIDNITTMSPDLFKSRKGSPARAGRAFHQLHHSGLEFKFRFELFSMIEDYLNILSTKDVDLPEGYHEIIKAAEPVKAVLLKNPGALAPCHCDPLCENFLDDGEKMWIVDWEYSGQNDPLWDLGDLSVEGGFDDAQDMEMLAAYCGGEPDEDSIARMTIYKAMCDLLWTLWGLIQLANNNPAEDFWAYAVERFQRCKKLMGDPQFQKHIQTIANG